jgi:predicted nucleotidyltransferase component of viral defense system
VSSPQRACGDDAIDSETGLCSEKYVFQCVPTPPVLRGYPEFADLPENRPVLVCSLNEIAAEKTVALTDPARNEPRDLYDLWYLTDNDEVHLDRIVPAICQKLEFREKPCEGLQRALARKEARLRALWNTRLAHQMAALPPFEQVFRQTRRIFRQANLP